MAKARVKFLRSSGAGQAERLQIWQRTFPAEAPRAEDIDLASMARKFKLTGVNIRNVVLAAAFLAAAEQHRSRCAT